MEEKTVFNREELVALICKAQLRVRVLGTVSFDLPYQEIMEKANWFEKINNGELQVEIICESESDLAYNSLISANKNVSGQTRSYDIGNFIRIKNEPKIQIRDELARRQCKHIEPKGDIKERKEEEQFFSLRTCYLPIPIPVINIDNDYYITFSLTKFCTQEKFEKIASNHIWFDEYHKYFKAYFDAELGAKKYSTEITEKDNQTEIILMYNDKRHCMGPLPRQSFLNIPKPKNVIWAIIFTRDGRVLIHKRGKNAKDNRNMWDKSIGGHVDMEKDTVDTVKAAAREMLEELYKIEAEDQGSHTSIEIKEINPNVCKFMGEWEEDTRQILPFKEIKNNKDKIYQFRMNYEFSKQVVDSPRLLPNGYESPVRCFVDMYVFIMNKDFNEKKLENSSFRLFELHELYDCFLGEDITYFSKDDKKEVTEKFNASPDLKKIISGELWTELNAFADYLKKGLEG
jgi:isopentenyldiphosphate isomerase